MSGRRKPGSVASALLCVSILAVVGCGFFHDPNGPGSYQAVMKAEESAEKSLTDQGAKLERKQYPPGSAWAVDLSGKELSSKTFDALKSLDHVAELNLSGTNLTDAEMKQFADAGFAGVLVDLNLSNTAVSDEGLKELNSSLFLLKLNLAGTKVTDSGVTQWQKDRTGDARVSGAFKKVKITR